MPKINQEEYEVLKALDDKWKWIARNWSGFLHAYDTKPTKNIATSHWENFVGQTKRLDGKFQFIQWEDEEPHNIAELIEEYEYSTEHVSHVVNERVKALGNAWSESEGTEVKKQKLIEKWESAIGAAEFYGKGKEDRLIEYMRNFVDDLNRLDEPKVLSQELPVIPKFVAEWIEEMKQDERPLYSVMSSLMNKTNHEWAVWKSANKDFSEIVAQAWLDGYEVEEEQKYVVPIGENHALCKFANDAWGIYKEDIDKLYLDDDFKFTEQEIKDYDERFWPFAVKVEELEE